MKPYIIIAIIILVGVGISFGVSWYNDYQELKLEKSKLKQNELALQDSLHQYADSLTKAAVYIRDLNQKYEGLNFKYVALKAKFFAVLDSIRMSGNVTPAITDSTIDIRFSGAKGIAAFNGFTRFNKISQKASWELNLSFPIPIEVGASLEQENDIWRLVLESHTAGVKVRGGGALDSDTYRRLQKYGPPSPPKRFMIGGTVGEQMAGISGGYGTDDWALIGTYYLYNNYRESYRNFSFTGLYKPF